ncbi:hypothetical protein OsI_28266 [Oryza sativa Indica Group]|uniref:Uncharacterized protein n=3 Tax=Oryza TaxID=4527 RepID=B9FZM1_ORYSJ|nr:hypothetical protein OsI_28266 [Oryza sativa Indica Group]EEE68238.1 hypothetical protein OsJ_26436 [Oryza sativa Japonica Group]BAD13277.1 hypothetical protein [Oryza sativa Japonica Group]BAD20169.1 hypothetical protein [Oryza sativa Japonica Group]
METPAAGGSGAAPGRPTGQRGTVAAAARHRAGCSAAADPTGVWTTAWAKPAMERPGWISRQSWRPGGQRLRLYLTDTKFLNFYLTNVS